MINTNNLKVQKKTLNQKGFSIVESLLILVIIGAVSATGYYLYISNKKERTDTNQTAESSITKADENDAKAPLKYLEIKEWEVKLPIYDKKFTDLYYTDLSTIPVAEGEDAETLTLTSTTLRTVSCEEDGYYPSIFFDAKLYRTKNKDQDFGGGHVVQNPEPIDGYYYTLATGGGGGNCTLSNSDRQLIRSLNSDAAYDAAIDGIIAS